MKAPWHLWVVGVVSLLWNGVGGYDYLMTQMGDPDYIAQFSAAQLAMLEARPAWFDAAWAVGVWGSILGSVLLLLRSRHAASAFGASIVGLVVTAVWSFGLATPSAMETMGLGGALFATLVLIVLAGLWAYAKAVAPGGPAPERRLA